MVAEVSLRRGSEEFGVCKHGAGAAVAAVAAEAPRSTAAVNLPS